MNALFKLLTPLVHIFLIIIYMYQWKFFFLIVLNFMKGAGAAHQGVSDCSLDWSYVGVPVLVHFVFGARRPFFDPGLFHLLIQLSSNK